MIIAMKYSIDGKREIRGINMEFRARYESGIEASKRGKCSESTF